MGYFEDAFVKHFVKKAARRSPLINRGYYVRHKCLLDLLENFQERCASQNTGCQVLVLGAGFDTRYFQLKQRGVVLDKYVELDFLEVTQRKCMTIATKEPLKDVLEADNATTIDGNGGSIQSAQYTLLPADLRDLPQVTAALESSGLDFSKPVFVVCECVLVYMEEEFSKALIRWMGDRFATSAIVIYEQIQPHTRFGEQMVKNLALRGADLKGIYATPTIEAHRERLTSAGWTRAFAADLKDIYQHHIDPSERARIERIEMFDEFEEWHMIMSHYVIAVGVKDDAAILEGLGFPTYAVPTVAVLATRGLAPGVPDAMQLPIVD